MELRALWWWIDRWRKSSAYTGLTLEEQGAYRNLLDEAHLRGGLLTADEQVLAKACGDARRWRWVRAKVLAHFTATPEGWRNETLDAVMRESQRRAEKQRAYYHRATAGNNGGNNPGNNGGNGHGNNGGNTAGNTTSLPVPVPVPVLVQEPDPRSEPAYRHVPAPQAPEEGFHAFWAVYPRKTAKQAALKAWRTLQPNAALRAEIADALAWQVLRDEWQRDNGKYIPHPATWLHRGQWADEPPPAASLLSDLGRQNLANSQIALARIQGRES